MPTVSFNTHLPDYEVLAELGRGNTRVLKARHVPTGDIVAIKQYAFATDADTLQRFERESQIMTQINHPNVVRVREVQLGASMPYVVMDFVEGGDLRGLLRQLGHLDIPTTIRLGLQLTEAFRAMHPLHVIHRDVKPENVLYRRLVSGELHFLLTDFGIAKLRADDSTRTRTGQSLMTYEYAAPEQFDNPRHVDEAADYYALGAVLYECITGHVPFVLHHENGLGGFMNQVLTAPIPKPVLPSGQPLPPSLGTLLMSLLIRNPAHRLRDPDQLELLLEQSRVEHLKASRMAQPAPVVRSQTVAGPVVAATALAGEVPDETGYVPEEETGLSSGTWWGIGGIVVAIGLAAGLYIYSDRDVPTATEPQIDSTMLMQRSSVPTISDSSNVSTDEPVPQEEEATEEPAASEPTRSTPFDSTTNTPPDDSLSRVPPDSTE
ncbi:serine/threonine-protein kinase [Fibrivirga algicola]|uniref:non-specific serine/threonine protein kinase n=1 Tax=Fibrivirga algicola TaxID=2950420 RepID=A0ABX0QJV3_9BACT|nr:serine/threonine-protein kinase [Fibrivirga algicola]NID12372.1 serine/threonine protein kinase [Fibrivirga algicola]